MKKHLATLSLIALLPALAMAQTPEQAAATSEAPAVETLDPVQQNLQVLQNRWAEIKYQIADTDSKLEAIHALEATAETYAAANPKSPELKIWQAIILSTDAGITKSFSGLGKVKKARALLEEALAIDPTALEGSAQTSLGSLYYQVPGWPVSFGDKKKAEEYLKQALQLNPTGIDPNYFYGDLMLKLDRDPEARQHFELALQAPNRPGRALADAGRRQEIKAALAQLAAEGE